MNYKVLNHVVIAHFKIQESLQRSDTSNIPSARTYPLQHISHKLPKGFAQHGEEYCQQKDRWLKSD